MKNNKNDLLLELELPILVWLTKVRSLCPTLQEFKRSTNGWAQYSVRYISYTVHITNHVLQACMAPYWAGGGGGGDGYKMGI